jgi:hypothetical protein
MTCRYCGLETGSGAGHRSQAECIQALSQEIDRAKRLISSFRESPPTRRVVEPPQPVLVGDPHGVTR